MAPEGEAQTVCSSEAHPSRRCCRWYAEHARGSGRAWQAAKQQHAHRGWMYMQEAHYVQCVRRSNHASCHSCLLRRRALISWHCGSKAAGYRPSACHSVEGLVRRKVLELLYALMRSEQAVAHVLTAHRLCTPTATTAHKPHLVRRAAGHQHGSSCYPAAGSLALHTSGGVSAAACPTCLVKAHSLARQRYTHPTGGFHRVIHRGGGSGRDDSIITDPAVPDAAVHAQAAVRRQVRKVLLLPYLAACPCSGCKNNSLFCCCAGLWPLQ